VRPLDPRLLREAPAVRRFLGAAALLGLLGAAATVAQAVALGRVVAGVLLEHRALGELRPELLTLVGAAAVRAVVGWALESGGRLTALRVGGQLRRRVLAHLLEARPGGLPETPTGELAASVTTGLDALDPYFGRFLPQLVLATVVPAVVLCWVALHDLTSAVVMAATLPLIPIFGILVGKATQARTLRRFRTLAFLSSHFLDLVRGLPTLRAFGRAERQTAAIAETSDAYRRETMGTLRIAFLSALVLELAATLSTAVIAVEIGVRLVDGRAALAPSLAVLVLAPELYGPLRNAAAQFHASADGLVAAERLFALLDLEPEVPRPADPLPVPDPTRAAVQLDLVSLRYGGRGEPAVDALTAVVAPGELVALVGPSGAGKSSALALLLRLAQPTGGRILVGGVDLAAVDPDAWRAQLAWLPQRPLLEPGTLRDALAAGRALDDGRLLAAVEAAGAGPVVAALPDGLDTVLGERTPLSAGEQRRIALARALAGDEPLLLLDEPTTHLDPATAAHVTGALRAAAGPRTVVVATHDPLLVEAADRVVPLAAPAELRSAA
jgi:thiol reductant ABC exporter CydD subunit